jgi:hypothetical protein
VTGKLTVNSILDPVPLKFSWKKSFAYHIAIYDDEIHFDEIFVGHAASELGSERSHCMPFAEARRPEGQSIASIFF